MTIKDINTIIETLCPNDEDYEKPCISPKYLRQELEQLALEQEHRHLEQEPTDKNFTKADIDAIVKAINAHWELIIDEIRAEIKAVSHGKWYVGRTDGKAEEVLLMADVLQIIEKYKAESEEIDAD